ncbi:MAG: hypothetical protein J5I92_01245 [Thiogranum sp.]|nr:hypothetical protein [Thiogranum sp.]
MKNNAELIFFSKWLKSPLRVASVIPSSAQLARAMASALPQREGLVVELGGGTGPITHALLQAGVNPGRLVVIERDSHFCRHLTRRFPGITVLRGDALHMAALVEGLSSDTPTRAVVSGLPMLSMPADIQRQLLQQAMHLTHGKGPLIQFSYSLASPLRRSVEKELGLIPRCVAHVWRNVPPAKVWTFESAAACSPYLEERIEATAS